MPVKKFYIENIGEISITKRRRVKRINLRVVNGQVKITQPMWLPFNGGLKFAISNKNWIAKQQYLEPELFIQNGQLIGKEHILVIQKSQNLSTTVKNFKIFLNLPDGLNVNDKQVLKVYKSAVARALKKEAMQLLPERLDAIANTYNFDYQKLSFKAMRSRWGSCNSKKNISINIFLMLAPWDLIDYVIVHELAHTRHLHHGKDFWDCVASVIPNYKDRQKQLKSLQKQISPLQT